METDSDPDIQVDPDALDGDLLEGGWTPLASDLAAQDLELELVDCDALELHVGDSAAEDGGAPMLPRAITLDPAMAVEASALSESPRRSPTCASQHRESTTSAPALPKKNRARERMQAELAFLRERVHAMETELESLRCKQLCLPPGADLPTTSTLAWQEVAIHELDQRRISEVENARLRALLDRQIRIAKSLERTLRKRSSEALGDLLEGGCQVAKRVRLFGDVEAQWHQFLDEIDHAYLQVDHVLEKSGLQDRYDESRNGMEVKIRSCDGGSEELFVEVRNFKRFPFALSKAAIAGWRATKQIFMREDHRVVEMYRSEDDHFEMRYRSIKQEHGVTMTSEVTTLVMKRFMTADRMVIVWRSMATPSSDHLVDGECANYTDETGYCVYQEVPSSEAGARHRETCLVSCVHLVPRLLDSSAFNPTSGNILLRVGDLTRMVIDSFKPDDITTRTTLAAASFQREVVFITDAVHSMLLEDEKEKL